MTDFLTALGLALAIEGVAYALFPSAMQRMMAQVLTVPPPLLRLPYHRRCCGYSA